MGMVGRTSSVAACSVVNVLVRVVMQVLVLLLVVPSVLL